MTTTRISLILLIVFFFGNPILNCEAALYIDDTSTTEYRKWYMEIGTDYSKDVEREFDPETEEYNKTVCWEEDVYIYSSFGISQRQDIGITVPYNFLYESSEPDVNGFSDITVETKYRLWDEGKIMPSYAFYFDIKADNANKNKGLGSGKKDYSVNNIFTKTIGRESVDLNFGYILVGGKAQNLFTYSFDLTHDLTEKISLCNEIYGETAFEIGFSKNLFSYGLSLSCRLADSISFDSGVGFGITRNSPDYEISNSLSVTF